MLYSNSRNNKKCLDNTEPSETKLRGMISLGAVLETLSSWIQGEGQETVRHRILLCKIQKSSPVSTMICSSLCSLCNQTSTEGTLRSSIGWDWTLKHTFNKYFVIFVINKNKRFFAVFPFDSDKIFFLVLTSDSSNSTNTAEKRNT